MARCGVIASCPLWGPACTGSAHDAMTRPCEGEDAGVPEGERGGADGAPAPHAAALTHVYGDRLGRAFKP